MSRISFFAQVKTGKRSFMVAPPPVAKTLGLMSAINSAELELYAPDGTRIEADDPSCPAHDRVWAKYAFEAGVDYEVRRRAVDQTAAAAEDAWIRACTVAELRAAERQRIRVELQGRDVMLWAVKGGGGPGVDFGCIDAVCYHYGGPLDLGDIEELMGDSCVVCPWHRYPISLRTGESMTRARGDQPCKSKGVKQRVHEVRVDGDALIMVRLNKDPDELPSDVYAGMGLLREAKQLKPPPRVHSSMNK